MKRKEIGKLFFETFIYGLVISGLVFALSWACEKERELGIHGKSSAAIGERIEK